MKKFMDKLFLSIKFDKRYIFFVSIISLAGIIVGSLFITILNSADKELIIEYIESYVENIINNKYNFIDLFKNNLLINTITLITMSIFGFTIILFILNILIVFYKSFMIGFTLSSFILTYKLKGILLSIVYAFPHIIINILLLIILTAFTMKLSINIIKNIFKKKDINLRIYIKKYFYIIMIVSAFLLLTSLYESFISPRLLILIGGLFK